jgi:hypothetical protein
MATILPGWSSVEAAARWHKTFEIAGFAALGLLLLFEVLAYIYGSRRDALAEAERTNTEIRLRHEQELAEQQSMASIRAAEDAAQKAIEAGKNAEQKAAELIADSAPRTLTTLQDNQISEFLGRHPKGSFVIKANITVKDARQFADKIAELFRTNGWQVKVDNAIITGPNPIGLWITVRDPNVAPLAAVTLRDALKSGGISIRAEYDPQGPALDEVWLSVGSK